MSKLKSDPDFDLSIFTKGILLSTAFVTAISYYIGWSELSAYYLWFGISPSFINKPISEVIWIAWSELLLGVFVIILASIALRVVDSMQIQNSDEKSLVKYILVFVLCVIMCVATLSLTLYLRHTIAIKGAFAVLVIYGFVLFMYVATILGYRIQESIKHNNFQRGVHKLVKLLYPSALIYGFLTLLALVFVIRYLGIWKGSARAASDERFQGQGMLGVSLYSEKPLPIEGEIYDQVHQIYSYKGLKLMDSDDEYIFVVKFDSVSDSTTYILPKTERLVIESVPWQKRPTQRAPDGWVRAAFSSIFLAWSFFRFDSESRPAHPRVTLTVRYYAELVLADRFW
jgi:hypothetical protein